MSKDEGQNRTTPPEARSFVAKSTRETFLTRAFGAVIGGGLSALAIRERVAGAQAISQPILEAAGATVAVDASYSREAVNGRVTEISRPAGTVKINYAQDGLAFAFRNPTTETVRPTPETPNTPFSPGAFEELMAGFKLGGVDIKEDPTVLTEQGVREKTVRGQTLTFFGFMDSVIEATDPKTGAVSKVGEIRYAKGDRYDQASADDLADINGSIDAALVRILLTARDGKKANFNSPEAVQMRLKTLNGVNGPIAFVGPTNTAASS